MLMGRNLSISETEQSYRGSKVAICALRALQERLEQLENERGRAFDKSMDGHEAATKEIEELKVSHETQLNRYKAQLELLQKKVETLNVVRENVETSLHQSRDECRDLKKQIAELFAERDGLREELSLARRGISSISKENEGHENSAKNANDKGNVLNQTEKCSRRKSPNRRVHDKSKIHRKQTTAYDAKKSKDLQLKAPFFTMVSKETHNLKAKVQDVLRNAQGSFNTSSDIEQRNICCTSIEAIFNSVSQLMASLSNEPSVRAYQQMAQLLANIDTAREKLAIEKPNSHHNGRYSSPDSRRSLERKLKMLSILRQFKSEIFGS